MSEHWYLLCTPTFTLQAGPTDSVLTREAFELHWLLKLLLYTGAPAGSLHSLMVFQVYAGQGEASSLRTRDGVGSLREKEPLLLLCCL